MEADLNLGLVPLAASDHKGDKEVKDGVCFKLCPAGQFVYNGCICERCPNGIFMKLPDQKRQCRPCALQCNQVNGSLPPAVSAQGTPFTEKTTDQHTEATQTLSPPPARAMGSVSHNSGTRTPHPENMTGHHSEATETCLPESAGDPSPTHQGSAGIYLLKWLKKMMYNSLVLLVSNYFDPTRRGSTKSCLPNWLIRMGYNMMVQFVAHYFDPTKKGSEENYLTWTIQQVCKITMKFMVDYIDPKRRDCLLSASVINSLLNGVIWIVYKMMVKFVTHYLYPTRTGSTDVFLNCLISVVCAVLLCMGLVAVYLYRTRRGSAQEQDEPDPRNSSERRPELKDPEEGHRNPEENHNLLLRGISSSSPACAFSVVPVMSQSRPSDTPPPAQLHLEQETRCTSVTSSA